MSLAPSSGPPHVLMTTDAVGGVWTYALDLGQELVRAGVRVTLAVVGPAPDAGGCAQAEAAGLEVRQLGGELDWTAGREAEVAASAGRLVALADGLRPHLIHLNSPALGAFEAFSAPVLVACHSCVATWWSAVKGPSPLPPELAWRARLTARGYAAADALLAPSHAFAEATRTTYGLARAPQVVRNGRSPAFSLDGRRLGGGDGAAASSRTCWSAATSVLTAGRLWDEGKDVATLDRAAGRLRSGLAIHAAGTLIGPQGQSPSLQHIRTLGRLSEAELNAYLASRPVFVSSSLYEPFGLAVLEAAQAGCPLVLSDIATFRELWDGAAVFFPPGDDAAVARQLDALAAHSDRCAALGRAARVRARQHTAAAMTEGALQLYADLSPGFDRAEAAA